MCYIISHVDVDVDMDVVKTLLHFVQLISPFFFYFIGSSPKNQWKRCVVSLSLSPLLPLSKENLT